MSFTDSKRSFPFRWDWLRRGIPHLWRWHRVWREWRPQQAESAGHFLQWWILHATRAGAASPKGQVRILSWAPQWLQHTSGVIRVRGWIRWTASQPAPSITWAMAQRRAAE